MDLVKKVKKEEAVKSSVIIGTFWTSLTLAQKFAGFITAHSGRHLLTTALYGAIALSASSFASLSAPSALSRIHDSCSFLSAEKLTGSEDLVRKLYLTCGTFMILEQLPIPGITPLKTLIPSSLLVKGVFARSFGGSTPATSAIATDAQRRIVQAVGRWRGCHHCGSRLPQLLSTGTRYIADHMPPTKTALILNDKWWRKRFNFQVCGLPDNMLLV